MKYNHFSIHPYLFILPVLLGIFTYLACGQNSPAAGNDVPVTKKSYAYKTVGQHRIMADVYRAPDQQIRPAIIWIHGGALIFGSRNWLSAEQMQCYVKAGYVVVAIDYRFAPETQLDGIIKDLQDAYAWVRTAGPDSFMIDPDRIAVVGQSAGGYLTLMSGICLSPPVKALVSFYGYGDLTGAWYSQPDSFYNQDPPIPAAEANAAIGDTVISETPTDESMNGRLQFYFYCRQQGLWPLRVGGHDPVTDKTWFKQYEPLRNVTSAYPPTMLLHGQKDNDVPFRQSVMMADSLKRHHVEYEFITNPDWGHMFDDNPGWKDPEVREAFDRVVQFLDKHLN